MIKRMLFPALVLFAVGRLRRAFPSQSVGWNFHARLLAEDKSPQLCRVTKIQWGVVYYRVVWRDKAGKEILSTPSYIDMDKWPSIVKSN
jgi:hypothetical protein